jgi:peptide/nickel transport system permease protein
MGRLVVRRLLFSAPVLLGISLLVFVLVQISPGDPVIARLGSDYDPRLAEQMRRELGLDRPIPVQYADWLWRTIRGDLGRSLYLGQPVADLIRERVPVTFILAALTMGSALAIAVPLGVLAAGRKDSVLDAGSRLVAMVGISMPVFWVGLVLIVLFAHYLRWFPAGGTLREYGLRALVLPAISLGVSFAALITRMTRSSMIDVLAQDYIRTARAKGLRPNAVHFRHALLNAVLPIITLTGIQFGSLLGGAALTETVFGLPGLGRLLIQGIERRDYPLIQGAVLVVACIYVFANLAVDLLYAWFDPRLRYA